MNRRVFIKKSLGTVMGAGACAACIASEVDGFVSLFNGGDLLGWDHAQGDSISKNYRGGQWFVEDGAICGRQ